MSLDQIVIDSESVTNLLCTYLNLERWYINDTFLAHWGLYLGLNWSTGFCTTVYARVISVGGNTLASRRKN